MKFELEEYHRGISDDDLLTELRRIAEYLRKATVSRADNDELGKFGTTTYIRRFGSWFKALELAGLEKTRTPMNLSDEELFHNLEEVWTRLGRQPRYAELQKPLSKYHVKTYENRFGSFRKALGHFVDYINGDVEPSRSPANTDLRTIFDRATKRGVNWRLRFIIMRRDNFRCVQCGRSPATDPSVVLHIDHIRPWSKGGESTLGNLQTLCSVCNIGKSDLE